MFVEEYYSPTFIYHPGKKSFQTYCDALSPSERDNIPFGLSDFAYQGLNISDDPRLAITHIAENNPLDHGWIQTQQKFGTELAMKAAKYCDQ